MVVLQPLMDNRIDVGTQELWVNRWESAEPLDQSGSRQPASCHR